MRDVFTVRRWKIIHSCRCKTSIDPNLGSPDNAHSNTNYGIELRVWQT